METAKRIFGKNIEKKGLKVVQGGGVHPPLNLPLIFLNTFVYNSKDNCVLILEGHAAPVRGLLWNPEIPYLLLSGSWDYTIKVWDTR